MASGAPGSLTADDVRNGEDGQGVHKSFKALNISRSSIFELGPSPSSPHETAGLDHHAYDSGYGSVSSTPDDNKRTAILGRKPDHVPFIRQLGVYVSTTPMKAETKQRFLEVQLEVEKLLVEFMRSIRHIPGRHKPIAIRPMMLSKADIGSDADPYMVVICPDTIQRKIQGFFDDPLVKSLYEPDEDGIPSFKVLVIGRALKLRASTSDIIVDCNTINDFHLGEETFCGMPIRLSDQFGHSRSATFGGIVKVRYTGTNCHLYGLTAGHVIRSHRVVMDDVNSDSLTLGDNDSMNQDLSNVAENTSDEKTSAPSLWDMSIGPDRFLGHSCFYGPRKLGKVIDTGCQKALTNEEQDQTKPYLDWAIFELNAYRPNKIAIYTGEYSQGDLHLTLRAGEDVADQIPVSVISASQQVKNGVLSTSRARVLLDPGDSFTDAYTLSLEDGELRDGDCGSWVVDVLRCEVYGHVVADDVFGNVYVIPMRDILADIRRCLGATSVDLPTGLDIISMATQQQPSLISQALFMERNNRTRAVEAAADNPAEVSTVALTRLQAYVPVKRSKPAKDSGYSSWAGTPD